MGGGREQITCIHSLVRAKRCPCGLMIGRCFLCCICREKGANQNKLDFDSAHLSPVKRLEKPMFGLARKKSPKTYCRVSAIFNQLFFQAAAVLSFALRKWGNYFYQLQWMPRYVISMCFWKLFLVWQKGSNHIRLKKKKRTSYFSCNWNIILWFSLFVVLEELPPLSTGVVPALSQGSSRGVKSSNLHREIC